MAQIKKNQLANIIFPMVDKTDFASIESGITASDFNSAATKKVFGVTHGNSTAFTSATISKAATLVRSGIFQQTLKATETNYDYLVVRFTHASCADQILVFQPVDYDDSDLMSRISDVGSDLRSYLVGMSGMLSDVDSQLLLNASMISDAHSAATLASSRALVVQSLVSDVDSQLLLNASMISDMQSALDSQFVWTSNFLSDMNSDLASKIGGITASVGASDISDIASAVWADAIGARVDSRVLLVLSNVSDVQSAIDSQFAVGIPLTASDLSDLRSAITAGSDPSVLSDILSAAVQTNSRVLVVQSNLSDVQSALDSQFVWISAFLSDMNSDLSSQIGGVTASIGASDISDIASAVQAILASDISDIYSAAAQGNSRALVIVSNLSDVESALDSQFVYLSAAISDAHSDLYSAIGNVSVTLTASDISDIASATAAAITTIDASDISDIASAVQAILASDMSDILSAAQQGNSRILVVQSNLSDVESQIDLNASVISDVQSAIDSQFAAGIPLTASDISDLRSAIAAGDISTLSDILLAAQQANSRILVTQSQVSNVESALDSQFTWTSNYLSDMHSDLNSAIDGITTGIDASDISDIASAVKVILASDMSDILSAAQQTNSRVLVGQSMLSDIDSQLDLNASMISDVDSQVNLLPTASALISDIWSAATADPLAVNLKEIDDTSVAGDGAGTPWGPE